MDPDTFRRLLAQLDLAALTGRRPLRLEADQRLAWGDGGEPDVIVGDWPEGTAQQLADWLQAEAGQLLADYYRLHPLTREGFDHQAQVLFAHHGAGSFAAPPGEWPAFTLFVDGGCLVAEPRAAARHRYGAYCELPRAMDPGAVGDRVRTWLASGEAYERYLGMNVCRYNC